MIIIDNNRLLRRLLSIIIDYYRASFGSFCFGTTTTTSTTATNTNTNTTTTATTAATTSTTNNTTTTGRSACLA